MVFIYTPTKSIRLVICSQSLLWQYIILFPLRSKDALIDFHVYTKHYFLAKIVVLCNIAMKQANLKTNS